MAQLLLGKTTSPSFASRNFQMVNPVPLTTLTIFFLKAYLEIINAVLTARGVSLNTSNISLSGRELFSFA